MLALWDQGNQINQSKSLSMVGFTLLVLLMRIVPLIALRIAEQQVSTNLSEVSSSSPTVIRKQAS